MSVAQRVRERFNELLKFHRISLPSPDSPVGPHVPTLGKAFDLLIDAVAEVSSEPEPFVPQTATRAQPRARLIAKHAGSKHLIVDWGWACDRKKGLCARLSDPFARDYEPWRSLDDEDLPIEDPAWFVARRARAAARRGGRDPAADADVPF